MPLRKARDRASGAAQSTRDEERRRAGRRRYEEVFFGSWVEKSYCGRERSGRRRQLSRFSYPG